MCLRKLGSTEFIERVRYYTFARSAIKTFVAARSSGVNSNEVVIFNISLYATVISLKCYYDLIYYYSLPFSDDRVFAEQNLAGYFAAAVVISYLKGANAWPTRTTSVIIYRWLFSTKIFLLTFYITAQH